jgi:hypothetical protein
MSPLGNNLWALSIASKGSSGRLRSFQGIDGISFPFWDLKGIGTKPEKAKHEVREGLKVSLDFLVRSITFEFRVSGIIYHLLGDFVSSCPPLCLLPEGQGLT